MCLIYVSITWNQVGYPACERHPGVGELRAAYFSTFHPDEREDASEESRDDGAHGQRSAAVKVHWETACDNKTRLSVHDIHNLTH